MLPGALIVGAICGVLGGLFIIVNSNLGILRKKYITSNTAKLVECVLFSVATTTSFYFFPKLLNDCRDATGVLSSTNHELVVEYDCPPGQYSPMATMFMNTEGSAIRSIISGF